MLKSLRVAFVGDVMLGRLVNRHLRSAPATYPWGDCLSILHRADLRICNLECAISDRGVPWHYTPKVFHFKTDPKNVQVLKAADIDIVSLANNHSLDFGNRALSDTSEILDKAQIAHAGVGSDIKEAIHPAVHERGGLKLAMLALTDNEPAWEAKANQPGVYYCPIDADDSRSIALMDAVVKLKRKVDLVVISLHWGPNWGHEPPLQHILFAHALIDAGADVIYGHSPHVFRAVEIYRGRPIMYSTGDFIDDYAVDEIERNDESFIFCLDIKNTQPFKLTLYPTMIDYFQAKLAGDRAAAIAARMSMLCNQFGTNTSWHEEDQSLQIPIA